MLKIGPEHFAAFADEADTAFVGRVVGHLQAEHGSAVVRTPDRVATVAEFEPGELAALVRATIARGRSHGLTEEWSLAAFVALAVEIAPSFDAHPLIRRVLGDEQKEANVRVADLIARVSEKTWEAAAKEYDPAAWLPAQEGA